MKCAYCKEELPDNNQFCSKCGRKIATQLKTNQGEVRAIVPASENLRLVNYFLDLIFAFILAVIIEILVMMVYSIATHNNPDKAVYYVVSYLSIFLYFLLFEGLTGKTVAKFITRTRVITKEGQKPGFKKALIRSLCRFIPFDAFSFLGLHPVGWHDSIVGTLVVRDKDPR